MWDVSKKTYIKTSAVNTPRQTRIPTIQNRTNIYLRDNNLESKTLLLNLK